MSSTDNVLGKHYYIILLLWIIKRSKRKMSWRIQIRCVKKCFIVEAPVMFVLHPITHRSNFFCLTLSKKAVYTIIDTKTVIICINNHPLTFYITLFLSFFCLFVFSIFDNCFTPKDILFLFLLMLAWNRVVNPHPGFF